MIDAILEISGYLLTVCASMGVGFLSRLLLQRFSGLASLIWVIVTTIIAVIPLFLVFVFVAPPSPLPPRSERQRLLELQFFESSLEPFPYRSPRVLGLLVPNHLENTKPVSTIAVRYMSEIRKGEDGCFSVEIKPPDAKLMAVLKVQGADLSYVALCRSFPLPISGFRLATPNTGTIAAHVTIEHLPAFFEKFKAPWQAQIVSNSQHITEDVRDYDARSRNIRDVPFLRPITLNVENPRFHNDEFAIDLELGGITVETNVSRRRVLSEEANTLVFWTSYFSALGFLSGAGWILLRRLSSMIKARFGDA